ncbi:hypothetical protein VA7868_04613 [Vibrio aerogenes CECT 7868]|uniref:Uncharacterized protein n=1 Tax=Vibrio aerogenes CECT 7868 TaxID=1216006 RepID=A0A1M6FB11_9VIBR|nr:YdcH family protein [Vibrio aerogenes]SHI94836.1 hypothetical protein VA7868_04613 [Vibrio aerogenes CECT 7868]
MIIQASTKKQISVGGRGRYLIVRASSAPVYVSTDTLRPQRLQTGDRINVEQFNELFVEHHQSGDVTFDYQISDLEHKPAATDDIVIRKIIEPIQFEAHVKVDDGLQVKTILPAQMSTFDDITIQPGERVRLTRGGFHQVTIQVISDEMTKVRVGDVNAGASRGLLVMGSKSAIGSLSIDYTGELHAYNASETTAILTIMGVQ